MSAAKLTHEQAIEVAKLIDGNLREYQKIARERDDARARAAPFDHSKRTRKPGAKMQRILDIVAAHPELAFKPAALWKMHSKEKLFKDMGKNTFGARVSEARKTHGMRKP